MYYSFYIFHYILGIGADQKHSTKFTDVKGSCQFDTSAQQRLQDMKENIAATLNENNIHSFYIPWKDDGGFSPIDHEQHREYLENFHETVIHWLQERITQQIKDNPMYKGYFTDEKQLYYELLSHYKSYSKYTATKLHGLEEAEERLKKTLAHSSGDHQMVLLYGAEGSGKSCVLSQFCKVALDMLGHETVLVLRYVGTSDMLCTVREVLRSICTQLNHILKKDTTVKELDEGELVEYYQMLLKTIGDDSDLNVLMIIDGVESLKLSVYGAELNLNWMILRLPKNIHLYVSYTTNTTNIDIFHKLKSKVAQKDSLIETPPLDRQAITDIAKDSLSLTKRHLTKEQENLIVKATKESGNPFILHTLLNEACSWTSTWQSNGGLPTTVEEIINRKFVQLEFKYGVSLVGHVIRYISSAYHGLSEVELMDILSSSNEVLLLAYPTDMPKLLRFPHSLWQDMRTDLGKYVPSM